MAGAADVGMRESVIAETVIELVKILKESTIKVFQALICEVAEEPG